MLQLETSDAARAALRRWFGAALDAVEPEQATRRALACAVPPARAPGVIAIGKASHGMARAAVTWLEGHGVPIAGGVIVSHQPPTAARQPLDTVVGDHPVPGVRSLEAADRLGDAIAALPPDAPVMVFVSGGASALVAAPLAGITLADLTLAFEIFHEVGLEIHAMNALRRQLTRWSGGRLAEALAGRVIEAWVISDVLDNDLAAIGSGPLVGGEVSPGTLSQVRARPDLVARLPGSVATALGAAPPGRGTTIMHHLVADRTTAAAAAIRAAAHDGAEGVVHDTPLAGDVSDAATDLAEWLSRHVRRHTLHSHDTGIIVAPALHVPCLHVWTGEATVALPRDHGVGGRAQQFALVMARELSRLAARGVRVHNITVLAAGTDGRDGPTDAAGAIVDHTTADRIAAAGIDLEVAISRCDAHPALEAVGALLRTGSTGTNVADIVMLLGWNRY